MNIKSDGEVICLAVIIVIFAEMMLNKQRSSFRSWLFGALCVLTGLLALFERSSIESLSGVVRAEYVYPIELMLISAVSMIWYYYIDTLSIGIRNERIKHYAANTVPFIISCAAVLLNGRFGLLFTLNSADVWQNGSFFWVYCACLVFYYLSAYAAVILGHAIARRRDIIVMYSLPAVLIMIFAYYAVTHDSAFVCAGYTVLLLAAFTTFQSRDGIIDELTGLQNRKGLMDSLRRPLGGLHESFTAIVVDLDDYKRYNEVVGYTLGDRTLTNIARYLSRISRPGRVFRYSGTAFVLILTGHSRDNAQSLVRNISDKLSHPLLTGNNTEYALSFRLGMVESDGSVMDEDYIIGAIDSLVSKKAGKLSVTHLDAECAQSINRRRAVMTALHNAIEADSLMVYYQPIYSVSTGTFEYVEALLRLRDPALEWIPPRELIAAAEEMGWASYVTYSVLERVCRFMALSGEKLEQKKYAINISAKCFYDDTFVERLLHIITETRTDPRRIVFEVQEREYVENTEKALSVFKKLHDFGINIALDDFMLGNSTVLSLMDIPVFAVKVDGRVLSVTDDNPMLLSSILTTLKRMGKYIVVKGAETREQCSLLRRLNCDHIQGYYFASPMSEEEFISFFQNGQSQYGDVITMER